MNFTKIILAPALLALTLSSCGSNGVRHDVKEYNAGTLSFNASRDSFNILQLTDIHLSNKDNQQLQLDFLDLTIRDAIKRGLDLIVLSGDVFTFADKATAERFFRYLDDYNVPWTITFGNHDEQCYFSVTWLTSYLNQYGSNCKFIDIQDDDVHGHANFYINVNDKSNNLFEKVIIFDSNRYNFGEYTGYDYIKQDQIDWYERVVKDTPTVESVCFFHIPLPEYLTAWQKALDGSGEATLLGGRSDEGVSAPKYNSGLFNKMVELGSTKGVFVGHDHENDSAILYKGIILSYGTNSTDRIYYKAGQIGGQLISINSDHTIDITRIHHEYSEVEDK